MDYCQCQSIDLVHYKSQHYEQKAISQYSLLITYNRQYNSINSFFDVYTYINNLFMRAQLNFQFQICQWTLVANNRHIC